MWYGMMVSRRRSSWPGVLDEGALRLRAGSMGGEQCSPKASRAISVEPVTAIAPG